jgi:hypothetical protein
VLARVVDIDYQVGPKYISLVTGGTNPNLDTYNPTSNLGLPERHLYDHLVMV